MAAKRSRATFEADLQAHQSPYVIYGTPLPPLDPDVRDDGSYVPVWKQEVTDEQGRKRLHGAFTGGFSAGYFNTVGSKEGWTPSTFVSSRSNKKKDATPAQQRPEDFMDDEDIADAEEVKQLQNMEGFSGLGSVSNNNGQQDVVMDIMKMTGDTVGIKLLKRMGWREGQGVGPKIRRRARLSEGDGMSVGSTDETHLFAPENSSMISFTRKIDRKGLGYELEPRPTDFTHSHDHPEPDNSPVEGGSGGKGVDALINGKKVKTPRSVNQGGFGVGILNDNGSDDEDPYAMGPKISYIRTVGGDKKKKKKPDVNKPSSNPLLNSRPIFISKNPNDKRRGAPSRRCHDGRLTLDGFVLSSQNAVVQTEIAQNDKYHPPDIPHNWKSYKMSEVQSQPAKDQTPYRSSADVAAASKLSPKSRAALLGETLLPGKSVFDFLTPNARTRIATASGNSNLPAALGEASNHVSSQTKTLQSLVPHLSRETAVTALGRGTAGWMPYAEDAAKRARYRDFLEFQAGLGSEGELPGRALGVGNDDWVTEMNEFAHAAQIFKPMTGMMASRFTSSSSAPKLASDNVAVERIDDSKDDESLLKRPLGKIKTPAEEAAAVGMYGPLTRSMVQFYPSRLLCKRFNIKPPAHVQADPENTPSGLDVGKNGSGPKMDQTHSAALPQRSLDLIGKQDMDDLRLSGRIMGSSMIDSKSIDQAQSEIDPGQDQLKVEAPLIDPERNEALEGERPGEAIFKAIFGSDSEDE